jgi:hypothetical protein
MGWSVSVSGDTAVVGARLDNCAGINAGAAYVFVDQGTTWDLQGKLIGHDTTDGDWFGYSVSISGDTIVAGSCCDDDLGPSSGSAYLFCRESGIWSESAKLLASDGSAVDGFGSAASIDFETVASASAADDDNGENSGSAYVFNLLREPVAYCTAKLNSCGTSPMISAMGAPSASDSSPFLVTGSNTRALKFGLLLYTDSGRGSLPFSGGTLCIGNTPAKRSIAVVDTTGTPGQCDGTLSIDMNAFARGSLGGNPLPSLTVPGTQINCQFWARDTIANGALLTDALEYFVCD